MVQELIFGAFNCTKYSYMEIRGLSVAERAIGMPFFCAGKAFYCISYSRIAQKPDKGTPAAFSSAQNTTEAAGREKSV
ncbi:hypothetical protein [Paenibacillus sp. FSL R7-0331]|uniref:hypothetical protein n=1 Tax=Paenibacillus sp. FSL R7-0331 TaxID=1536773 RepID=UPI0004F874BC|nr:hypothetical protein [Paenibacillus sp. FSL R7-0331]AIQ54489.1 hypothetical protein R70331_25200 [Paenibacillus sp. FSL R7-0331]